VLIPRQMSVVRRRNWLLTDEIFGCPHCRAHYKIIRRQTSPGIVPTCEDCSQEFLSQDRGEWLLYERVDALN
jgi:hypothetical protein